MSMSLHYSRSDTKLARLCMRVEESKAAEAARKAAEEKVAEEQRERERIIREDAALQAAISRFEKEQIKLNKGAIARIQKATTLHFNLSLIDLLGKRRTKDVVTPRHLAMYLAKKHTPQSLPEIGRRFGNRDHTTILHGVRKIEAALENPAISSHIAAIEARLGIGETE